MIQKDIRVGQVWRHKTGTEWEVIAFEATPSSSILSPLGLTLDGGWELGDVKRVLSGTLAYLDELAVGPRATIKMRSRAGVEKEVTPDELIETSICMVMGWSS